jgi:hypothetical protein
MLQPSDSDALKQIFIDLSKKSKDVSDEFTQKNGKIKS